LREEVSFLIEGFLTKKGWKHTCSLPGALWLWSKEVDGRTVYVQTDTAVYIQEVIDVG